MKATILISFLLLLGLTGACKQNYTVVIRGKVCGDKIPDKVEYSNPETGTCYFGFKESATVDSLGNFEIHLNIKKAMLVQFRCSSIYQKFLIVENGKRDYFIEFNLNDKVNAFRVEADNAEGQNAFNSFCFSTPNAFKTIGKYDNEILTLEDAANNIERVKTSEIKQLGELLDKGKISKDFYEIANIDRDCYFAAVLAAIARGKFEKAFNQNNQGRLDKIKNILEETYSNIINSNYLIASNYDNLLESYLYYQLIASFGFNYKNFVEGLTKIYEDGEFHTYFINASKRIYEGDILEFFIASYLWNETLQKNYENEFISLFEDFENDYPNSVYTRYLEPMIVPIIKYHNMAKSNFSGDINFVDNYEKINSLSEALEALNGKKVFVDVWATWCGPCKSEFKHKDKLNGLLSKYDIEILYISIDNDSRANQWENMIKYYDLGGSHIRANNNLISDITTIFDSEKPALIIPFYLLADETGKILKKHLPFVSEYEKLEKEFLNIVDH